MNAAALRKACLAMTGAEETFPFGPENSVFKVEGKIFAISRLGSEPPLRISLKCEPGLAEQLRASHAAITRPAITSTSATGTPSSSTVRSPTRWCAT
jgi:predicted DNA-binding protein (MmcQ/YjbR family)